MASPQKTPHPLTRRTLLKQLAASRLLRAMPLAGLWAQVRPGLAEAGGAFQFSSVRYTPHYPVRSPLEGVLRLVTPGLDEFGAERSAAEIEQTLRSLAERLGSGDVSGLAQLCDPALAWSPLTPLHEKAVRSGYGIDCYTREFSSDQRTGAGAFASAFAAWLGPEGTKVKYAAFEVTAIEPSARAPGTVDTEIHFELVLELDQARREQRAGAWRSQWRKAASADAGAAPWQMVRFEPLAETRAVVHGRGFVDVTSEALGATRSYSEQMLRGSDYWRAVLDGACGIDVYGNNGVAVGDFNNDGFDDLYVSQPAGLPNRLYRNRGDGTFEDVTEQAGVGVLDNTACALFADLRNSGLQDLVVVAGSGPLLFLNQGDGTFLRKSDAFHFAQPPRGTFTHAAIADYDRDGRLDLYLCVYSYYLGLDQYHYPVPYFDARNGPPNYLLHNQGDGTFTDRTEAAGLNAENDRYSFACAWGNVDGDDGPDLYVVNDFGRNSLYRNQGNGTFRAISAEAHVQDVGAGMSACWTDINNDGLVDLYVANMWSAAGQRISQQPVFHRAAPAATRALYQRHAEGNAAYQNGGDGSFANVTEHAQVELGRWAWGSDSWDFDHDGFADLYVTNGYITAPQPAPASSDFGSERDQGHQSEREQDTPETVDLASFFWRQVVAKSPDDAAPALDYEHGWNALNELIRANHSWNGRERNVLFVNRGDGTFSNVAGALGMDFVEDGRSFALADLDGDGRLEVVIKSRNAMQLRIVRNAMEHLGDAIAFRLRGTQSNRDGIGARITVEVGGLRQTKSLQAGSGFLSQHTKELFFGIGKEQGPVIATVHWPSGATQRYADLPRNARIALQEGNPMFSATPFRATAECYASATARRREDVQERLPSAFSTWLLDPLKAPEFTLPDATGKQVTFSAAGGGPTLLHLWAASASGYREQLEAFERARFAFPANRIGVLALNLDQASERDRVRSALAQQRLWFPVLFATEEVAGIYNILYRYLFDRRADLALPTSFLIDEAGMIVKVYQGATSPDEVLSDARMLPLAPSERAKRALPFPGTLYQGAFLRNDFTFGVAMFQHGYLDQAAASFEQVIATRPDDAEAHYNLGTLSLRRNDLAHAREQLQRTLELKPNYPEAWNNLGMMAAQQGQTMEAIRHFEQALQQRPTYTTALLNLGNLYRHERSFAEAQTYLARALKLQPDDPEANYSIGMLYAQQDQLQSASEYLIRAIQLRPDYAEALNNLGVLYVRQQRTADAEHSFLTSIQLAPEFQNSYLNLAQLYLVQHEREKAQKVLEDLLRRHPESAPAQQLLDALKQAS